MSTLKEYYPQSGLQKVLILGKNNKINTSLKNYFDKIILACEVFF